MARKAREVEADNIHVTRRTNQRIRLQAVDLLLLRTLMNTVEEPEIPTYEVKTASGRVEVHNMDVQAAKETEGGEEIWRAYQASLSQWQIDTTERSMKSIISEGTVPDMELLDNQWRRRMKSLGIPIPNDEFEAWILWVFTTSYSDEVMEMSNKILGLSGMGPAMEKAIEAAQDSFPDSVDGESERQENVEEPEANPEGNS